ncbi:MAG: class I SAM-dependent methyltransferase [Beijerinckiaceae bacterium]|nr:class I SAM-dependent methyltransferase [Beijerinckiaceae bacterium]
MTAGKIGFKDLDAYVAECDRLGGVQTPGAAEFLSDFVLDLGDLQVEGLDPFSEEYFQVQMRVYESISGRTLDQNTGELFDFEVDAHVKAQNPYKNLNASYVAMHVRAVAGAIALANLPAAPRILDMGSGWGMTAELAAFLGASVKAVDINPAFVDLINRRARRSGLPIFAELSTFDTLTEDPKYDAILFYESLHHAVKVWETLARAKTMLTPGGKIIIAGEPITDYHWKHWGVRTDSLSVYCIRKFGWFETGWSAAFLKQAFDRAGLDLCLYPYAGLQNTEVGIATRHDEKPRPDTPDHVFPYTHLAHLAEAEEIRKTLELTQRMHHDLSQAHHQLSLAHSKLLAELSRHPGRLLARNAVRFLRTMRISRT